MPGDRFLPLPIQSAVDGWDAPLNEIIERVFSLPYPPPEVATEAALPAAALNRNCIAVVLNFAGTGASVFAESDGATWHFRPMANYTKANGNGSAGFIDLLHPLMRVAEGFEIDFFLEPSTLAANAHVALAVYNSASTPALVTGNQYAARGSARYGAGVVADWSHAAQGYAGIGYVGASNYLSASEEAFGTIKFTRGGSNSAWHYSCQMYYDVQGAPGTGAQRMFSSQGTLLVPGGLLLAGVRLYLRDAASTAGATGTVVGSLTAASRVRVTF